MISRRIGMFNQAALGNDRYIGLGRMLNESIPAMEDAYSPLTEAVVRYRDLKEKRPEAYTEEDEQIAAQIMGVLRAQSFLINRIKKVMGGGDG